MSIEIQCMTEKLIVTTIKLDYSKVPSKNTVPITGIFRSQAKLGKISFCDCIVWLHRLAILSGFIVE